MLSFTSSVASFMTSLASRSRNLSFSRKHSAAESANPLLSAPESSELFIEALVRAPKVGYRRLRSIVSGPHRGSLFDTARKEGTQVEKNSPRYVADYFGERALDRLCSLPPLGPAIIVVW